MGLCRLSPRGHSAVRKLSSQEVSKCTWERRHKLEKSGVAMRINKIKNDDSVKTSGNEWQIWTGFRSGVVNDSLHGGPLHGRHQLPDETPKQYERAVQSTVFRQT